MKKLTVEYTRIGTTIDIRVAVDNVAFTEDSCHYCDKAHAEGHMADAFHEATQHRYKSPTPAINPFKTVADPEVKKEKMTNALRHRSLTA